MRNPGIKVLLKWVGLILVLWGSLWMGPEVACEEKRPEDGVVFVKSEDIAAGRAVILGRTGVALNQLVTIRGVVVEGDRSKPSGASFRVTHVAGRAVKKPFEFSYYDVAFAQVGQQADRFLPDVVEEKGFTGARVGEVWELRGFEKSSIFSRFPAEMYEESGQLMPQHPPGGDFVTTFEYCKKARVGADGTKSSGEN